MKKSAKQMSNEKRMTEEGLQLCCYLGQAENLTDSQELDEIEDRVKALLEKGADPNALDGQHYALELAVKIVDKATSRRVTAMLLQQGADPNRHKEIPPVCAAIKKKDEERNNRDL